ncbi:MAG: hypothetical protein K2J32_13270 [Ruminococcus sp.]|nr:hypothetical protein [Ruminococcus sp.]
MTSEKQEFIAGVTIFCIYAFITFLGIVSYLKRELYIFQECDYKISGYVRQIPKNYRKYIFPFVLCMGQIIMLATRYDEIYNKENLILLFLICNVIIALVNRPFRKRLQNTVQIRKIMITFFILTAIIFRISVFWSYDAYWCKCGMDLISYWFCNNIPFMIVNFALYLTPLLVFLSDILNKPFYSIKKYKEII